MACGVHGFLLGFFVVCLVGGGTAVDREQHVRADVGMTHHQQGHLSVDELTVAAAKHGMEVISPVEWTNTRRHLQAYSGSNCWDVSVTEPYGICDGVYYGEGDREVFTSLRGPTIFTSTCFEGNCGDQLSAVNRRMFLAQAFKCAEGQTVDCPKEKVWGVYSAVTNSTTGENRLGFLRAWAEEALHPVDVVTQWWTFEYTTLEEEDAEVPRECENPDCLIPVNNVVVECESPNWTLPPSITPYPTMTPTPDPNLPDSSDAPMPSEELGTFEDTDLNGARTGITPPLGLPLGGGGGLWHGIGVIAAAASWCAVFGRLGALGEL